MERKEQKESNISPEQEKLLVQMELMRLVMASASAQFERLQRSPEENHLKQWNLILDEEQSYFQDPMSASKKEITRWRDLWAKYDWEDLESRHRAMRFLSQNLYPCLEMDCQWRLRPFTDLSRNYRDIPEEMVNKHSYRLNKTKTLDALFGMRTRRELMAYALYWKRQLDLEIDDMSPLYRYGEALSALLYWLMQIPIKSSGQKDRDLHEMESGSKSREKMVQYFLDLNQIEGFGSSYVMGLFNYMTQDLGLDNYLSMFHPESDAATFLSGVSGEIAAGLYLLETADYVDVSSEELDRFGVDLIATIDKGAEGNEVWYASVKAGLDQKGIRLIDLSVTDQELRKVLSGDGRRKKYLAAARDLQWQAKEDDVKPVFILAPQYFTGLEVAGCTELLESFSGNYIYNKNTFIYRARKLIESF